MKVEDEQCSSYNTAFNGTMEVFKTKIFDWNASFHLFAALLELHFVKTQTHRFFYFVSQAKGQGTTFPLIRRKGSLWKTVSLKPKPSPSPFFSFHPSGPAQIHQQTVPLKVSPVPSSAKAEKSVPDAPLPLHFSSTKPSNDSLNHIKVCNIHVDSWSIFF
jgi:hypothetical protein